MKKFNILSLLIIMVMGLSLVVGCTPTDTFDDDVYIKNMYTWDGSAWVKLPGGANVTDVTYTNLVTAIGNSSLITGAYYRVTDYKTIHYIFDGNGTQYLNDIITGVNEPLIVLSTSNNTIGKQAYSAMYPQDIIYYDWDSTNWLNDLAFSDLSGGTGIIPNFKGVITFRHDTLLDNSAGFDWRNCKSRRWQTDPVEWDITSSYPKGAYVKETSNSNCIYFATKDINSLDMIDIAHTTDWLPVIDLYISLYWNCGPDGWNNIPSGTDYKDYKLFAEGIGNATYEKQCRLNHFTGIKHDDYYSTAVTFGSLLSGTVIYLLDSDYCETLGNNVGVGFSYNTIDGRFKDNTIDYAFNRNTIGRDFNSNTIKKLVFGNTIGGWFSNNTIGIEFSNNTMGESFEDNTIGDYFGSNTIGGWFRNNTIGQDFGGLDFTTSTYVYLPYAKELYTRPDGTKKLRYYDDTDTLVIVNATD